MENPKQYGCGHWPCKLLKIAWVGSCLSFTIIYLCLCMYSLAKSNKCGNIGKLNPTLGRGLINSIRAGAQKLSMGQNILDSNALALCFLWSLGAHSRTWHAANSKINTCHTVVNMLTCVLALQTVPLHDLSPLSGLKLKSTNLAFGHSNSSFSVLQTAQQYNFINHINKKAPMQGQVLHRFSEITHPNMPQKIIV